MISALDNVGNCWIGIIGLDDCIFDLDKSILGSVFGDICASINVDTVINIRIRGTNILVITLIPINTIHAISIWTISTIAYHSRGHIVIHINLIQHNEPVFFKPHLHPKYAHSVLALPNL